MNYKEIKPLVIEWAKAKNLTDSSKQYLKIFEEVGELGKAMLQNDLEEIKDAIGDICVTLIIYEYQEGDWLLDNIYDVSNLDLTKEELFKELINHISDMEFPLSTLNEIADRYNSTLNDCLLLAWNTIKNRTGKTVNGTFIKD